MSEILEKKSAKTRRPVKPSAEPPDSRAAKAALNQPSLDNRNNFYPAICYIKPADMGEPVFWGGHFVRAAEMGFDTVLLASPFASVDGLVLDYDVLDEATGGGEALLALSEAAHAGREAGVTLMLDLDIGRLALTSPLLDEYPDWFTPAGQGAAFRFLGENDAMVEWWDARIAAFQAVGITGFRCFAATDVAPAIWGQADRCGACARRGHALHGLDAGAVRPLPCQNCSMPVFDYGFSSSCWWDFKSAWLNEDAARIGRIGPAIALTNPLNEAFPESEAAHRRALIFAATYAAGWLMPLGFQLGRPGWRDFRPHR